MAKDILINKCVVDVNHTSPGLQINQTGTDDSIRVVGHASRDGQVVSVVPVGSGRESCQFNLVLAHVLENVVDYNTFLSGIRHKYKTTVIDINVVQNVWFDTGLTFAAGDPYLITTTGVVDVCDNCAVADANGWPGYGSGPCSPLPSFPHIGLIGEFVDSGGSTLVGPFPIGAAFSGTAPVAGRLRIRHNDTCASDNDGVFHSIIRTIDIPQSTSIFGFDMVASASGNTGHKFAWNGSNWVADAGGATIFTEFGINKFIYDLSSNNLFYTFDNSTLTKISHYVPGLNSNNSVNDLLISPETRIVLTSPDGNKWAIAKNTLRAGTDPRRGTKLIATPAL